MLAAFADCPVRMLPRGTEAYAEVERMLWHPVSPHDERAALPRATELLATQARAVPSAPSERVTDAAQCSLLVLVDFGSVLARRYREFMMSASAGFRGAQPVSASSPREIRAALVGEEAGHFDREYRQAMADAAESLDLSGVLAVLERWRRVAWSTRDDPEAHRKMLDSADRLSAGENIATVPWQQVKARLGL